MKKKLIEVSLPLDKINAEAAREKSIRHGHPSTLHLYWARRPLAAARAVLFAQLVDDPSAHPEEFPTLEDQARERARLHALIEDLVVWENSSDEKLLDQAREEIRKSNGGKLPAVLDPFAGGGAIPLEAQRLGLEAHASDLNPLAVLINKAMIEIPPKFAGMDPVWPGAARAASEWPGTRGLAEDVRNYGQWMRDEAFARIGHLYPTVKAPGDREADRTVIAWIWARTVTSPNPANPIEVPLVRTWWLSKKKGREAWVEAKVVDGEVRYRVRHDADGPQGDDDGTIGRRGGHAVGDGTPLSLNYVREEGQAKRMGQHLVTIVADGPTGRVYLDPTEADLKAAQMAVPEAGFPAGDLPKNPRDFKTPNYGMTRWSDLFTNRQLVALTTLSDLVGEARERVLTDALAAGMERGERLEDGGAGAEAYADAVATYLALAVSRTTDYSSSLCSWHNTREQMRNVFGRQAVPMVWDYAESNPFSSSSGNFLGQLTWIVKVLLKLPANGEGCAVQTDAITRDYSGMVISTDPPYYDNIGYSDLSDFFYVWLRRSLGSIHGRTLATMLTPKADELVANPYRHGGKEGAEEFFVGGFNRVFEQVRQGAVLDVPMTVYYAYKQQDVRDTGTASTGWHTLLEGLIAAGWEVTATWPIRSELKNRMIGYGTNALASSIVLACRPRPADAKIISRREFVYLLRTELPTNLRALIQSDIAPVDMAQAAIGPGISVFSRFAQVREPDGSPMSVRDALQLINSTLDEVLNEQESDFDEETRFAVKWYRQYGWDADSAGVADQLARSSNTTLGTMERGGFFEAKGGKARLLAPAELSAQWNPLEDDSISIWEATVRLAAILEREGVDGIATILAALSDRISPSAVKELGFLLFSEADAKGRTADAMLFNALVTSWGDVVSKVQHMPAGQIDVQGSLDLNG